MNVVLYTRELEPITVIDLPLWALELAERNGVVRVEANPPVASCFSKVHGPLEPIVFKVVSLEFHKVCLRNQTSWMVIVDDDETALALKPAWLPGQRGAINDYEATNRALAKVLLATLQGGMGL